MTLFNSLKIYTCRASGEWQRSVPAGASLSPGDTAGWQSRGSGSHRRLSPERYNPGLRATSCGRDRSFDTHPSFTCALLCAVHLCGSSASRKHWSIPPVVRFNSSMNAILFFDDSNLFGWSAYLRMGRFISRVTSLTSAIVAT